MRGYPKDVFPSVWESLESLVKVGKFRVCQQVWDEIESDKNEKELLKTKPHQRQLASVLCAGLLAYFDENAGRDTLLGNFARRNTWFAEATYFPVSLGAWALPLQ